MAIRIMVVDDHGIMRDGLHLLIGQQDSMKIVGEAANGRDAVAMAEKLKPDIVLMDVSMPGLNGIGATAEIIKGDSDAKVLALSAHSDKQFVTDMLKAGASGYVLKDCVTEELIRAINAVHAGERYLSAKVAGVIIDSYIEAGQPGSSATSIAKLTAKEREMLQLLVEGHSTKQIARLLHLSIKTVDGRRHAIMNKLNMQSLSELTKFAIREGLTSIEF